MAKTALIWQIYRSVARLSVEWPVGSNLTRCNNLHWRKVYTAQQADNNMIVRVNCSLLRNYRLILNREDLPDPGDEP